MLYRLKQAFFISVLLFTYFLLFHFQILQKLNNDFSVFYSAALAYLHHASPYYHLTTSFLAHPAPLAVNVNPPFFVLLISPLTYLDYTTASLTWAISSLIFGVLGWLLCFYLGSSTDYFKNNYVSFILIYFASYACLMNTSFNQVAGFLLFIIMTGYYFFQKENDYCCGVFWGFAFALKLFPGLLLIFVLIEKRYKIFWTMLGIFLITWTLPLLTSGLDIYLQFYTTIADIVWYGNTWNASILAYLFRIFVDMTHPHSALMIKIVYQVFFILIVLWYIQKLKQLKSKPHYGFCLSLIMMLLLSPFGWMYYFALLLPALILIYQTLQQEGSRRSLILWSVCLFLINLPTENVQSRVIPTVFAKITQSSIYFYGLLLVLGLFLYAIKTNPHPLLLTKEGKRSYLRPLEFILSFSVMVVFSTLSKHFYQ